MSEGVLCILGPGKEVVPAVLIFLAVCPELASKFLDLLLSLAVHLGMVSGRQVYSDP